MSRSTAVKVGMLAAVLAVLLPSSVAIADESPEAPAGPSRVLPFECEEWAAKIDELQASEDDLERQLGELHAEPDLNYCQTRRVRIDEQRERESSGPFEIPGWMMVSELVRGLVIIVLAALVIWLLWRWRRHLKPSRRSKPGPDGPASPVEHRASSRPVELPEDIPGAAASAWSAGDPRAAISLLYRGALDRLLPRRRADTEREVLAAIHRQALPENSRRYVSDLVRIWLQTAWANSPPTDQHFGKLRDEWSTHCETAATAAREAQ